MNDVDEECELCCDTKVIDCHECRGTGEGSNEHVSCYSCKGIGFHPCECAVVDEEERYNDG